MRVKPPCLIIGIMACVLVVCALTSMLAGAKEAPSILGRPGPLAFGPEGLVAVYDSYHPGIVIWQSTTGRIYRIADGRSVESLTFSDDGKLLASRIFPQFQSGEDPEYDVFDTATGALRFSVTVASQVAEYFVSFDFRQQGLWLISPHRVRLVHLATGETEKVVVSNEPILMAAASFDGRAVALADRTGIQLTQFGSRTRALKGPDTPTALAFAPEGISLAAGYADGSSWLWTNGKHKELLPRNPIPRSYTWTHNSSFFRVTTVAYSGHTLVAGSEDGRARMVDVAKGVKRELFLPLIGKYDISQVCKVACSPDGKRVATASWTYNNRPTSEGDSYDFGSVGIWDTDSGQLVAHLDGFKQR